MKHEVTPTDAIDILALYLQHKNEWGAVIIRDSPRAGLRWRWSRTLRDCMMKGRWCMIQTCPHTFLDTQDINVLAVEINNVLDEVAP
jgi:hypothetical protein